MNNTFVTISEMNSFTPIMGWQEYLEHGESFLRTAARGFKNRKEVFTPEILYNIIAMAIEKYIMAGLMSHGTLPDNHTMTDLAQAFEATFPNLSPDIRERLLHMDEYQKICDTDTFSLSDIDI